MAAPGLISRSFPRKRESNKETLGPRFRGDERLSRPKASHLSSVPAALAEKVRLLLRIVFGLALDEYHRSVATLHPIAAPAIGVARVVPPAVAPAVVVQRALAVEPAWCRRRGFVIAGAWRAPRHRR